MGRRKIKISKPRKNTFAFVIDGEDEVWYFNMLKRNEPNLQINIEPKIPQKKKLSDQFEKVKEYAEDFLKVFWIIDLDTIIKESKETKKGKQSKIQELKKYLKELKKYEFKNIITIINNPCLEFWFILHFEQTTKYFPKCKESIKYLKKHLKDYEKNKKYFTKKNNDIYLKLKPHLLNALNNTKNTQRKKTTILNVLYVK